MYRLINPDSICGYPFLAASDPAELIVQISSEHVHLSWKPDDEERGRLVADYEPTGELMLDVDGIAGAPHTAFGLPDVWTLARLHGRVVHHLEFVLGRGATYQEVALGRSPRRWILFGRLNTLITATERQATLAAHLVMLLAPTFDWARQSANIKLVRRRGENAGQASLGPTPTGAYFALFPPFRTSWHEDHSFPVLRMQSVMLTQKQGDHMFAAAPYLRVDRRPSTGTGAGR